MSNCLADNKILIAKPVLGAIGSLAATELAAGIPAIISHISSRDRTFAIEVVVVIWLLPNCVDAIVDVVTINVVKNSVYSTVQHWFILKLYRAVARTQCDLYYMER